MVNKDIFYVVQVGLWIDHTESDVYILWFLFKNNKIYQIVSFIFLEYNKCYINNKTHSIFISKQIKIKQYKAIFK